MKTLFIFRRDLRLQDNLGLIESVKESDEVYTCFIFTPEQIDNNPYMNKKSVNFMLQCLEELGSEIEKSGGKLYFFHGKPEEIAVKYDIDAVHVNRDYTPYSIQRDLAIKEMCTKKKIIFRQFDDNLLVSPGKVLTNSQTPYVKYTPFFRKCNEEKIAEPRIEKLKIAKFKENVIEYKPKFEEEKASISGGRKEALKILSDLGKFKNYSIERDYPSKSGTTHLSAYIKFGVISVREAYHAVFSKFGKEHTLIRELFWREFYYHIIHHFPRVIGHSFIKKYDFLDWSHDKETFQKWCDGKTGFPIVDAGMRELNATGWMHNRVRMIVASFLTKDLLIDWRWGEKYFAQKLVDYDPAVNNGSWQWASSTGCDSQPYFRIFNPWLQGEKYDPNCDYIKKWIPELREVPNKDIHSLYKIKVPNYPSPIVEHSKQAELTKKLFKST